MRQLAWVLVVVGVFGVLGVVGLIVGSFWIDTFIHSDTFRHQVEARAGDSVGGQVEIKQIDFSVWSGIKLKGVATKFESEQGTLVAQVEGINCSYSYWALLSRRLQLNGVTLVKPGVVLTQLPASAVATPRPPPVAGTAPKPKDAQSGKSSSFQVVLNAAKLIDGRLSIQDANAVNKADLQGVQVAANVSGFYEGKDIIGTLRIASISLPQNLGLTGFSTPFTYRAGQMKAGPFAADAFAGQITGDYRLDPSGPSLLEINATQLDVAQVGQAANPQSSTRLSGLLNLQSRWQSVEAGSLVGEGDAQITEGRLSGVTLLHDLAIALHVSELDNPQLKGVSAHFQVANGSTHFSRLRIDSTVFEMTGDGVIDPQGNLDASMVLTLHGEAMGGIPGAAAAFFSKLPGGAGSIPFHLGGTVANPQADLNTRLFLEGSKVEKSISRTLNKLFR